MGKFVKILPILPNFYSSLNINIKLLKKVA
jgi:hypothetical protein